MKKWIKKLFGICKHEWEPHIKFLGWGDLSEVAVTYELCGRCNKSNESVLPEYMDSYEYMDFIGNPKG